MQFLSGDLLRNDTAIEIVQSFRKINQIFTIFSNTNILK